MITALCFSATSTFFTLAGRKVGSMVVNRARLVLAVLFLLGAHWALLKSPIPVAVEGERWLWLSLSGVIGLVIGDGLLFQAFIWIGPRLAMLLMSLAPLLSAFLAWWFFSESLSPTQVLGIGLTLGGVAWVVSTENETSDPTKLTSRNYFWGVIFGLGGASGQALGLVIAKQGLQGDFSALSGTLIRMIAAGLTLWLYTLLRGQAISTFQQINRQPKVKRYIFGGAFTGPFLGVTFSLLAIQHTQIGVASTLMALPPVFLLPIGFLVFKESLGWQVILGTLLAMAGVAFLFLA